MGRFAAHLFTSDFQFFVPKYGVGLGEEDFREMASSAGAKQVEHHIADLVYIQSGNMVAVEGSTEGVGIDGIEWNAGHTPGGRFAVFSCLMRPVL